jgi:ribonuclease HII
MGEGPVLQYEIQAWANGHEHVAGMDEAGRGPLAGPVVAAVVVFERTFLERESGGLLRGLTDSKQLSAARRAHFYDLLTTCAHVQWAVGRAEPEEIDDLNILRATHTSMRRALEATPAVIDHVLLDGGRGRCAEPFHRRGQCRGQGHA